MPIKKYKILEVSLDQMIKMCTSIEEDELTFKLDKNISKKIFLSSIRKINHLRCDKKIFLYRYGLGGSQHIGALLE